MAKPAFIYAFDNLGSNRFTELCGELLGSRCKGFGLLLMGGVGADGGVDAELETNLGIWQPDSEEALLNEVIQPGKAVVFQFKHIVVTRAGGQAKARNRLLRLYQCRPNSRCELCRKLILQKRPSTYVLVTNIEVNSIFRDKFRQQCQANHPEIENYQVIGLDELETWITMETHLRHLYFPTIFGAPRFDLRVLLSEGFADFYDDGSILINSGPRPKHLCDSARPRDRLIDLFQVSILNIGTVSSYVSTIGFKFIVDQETRMFFWEDVHQEAFPEMKSLKNPKLGTPFEPGRRQTFRFPFYVIHKMKENVRNAFPAEVLVYDEIGNMYGAIIPEELRKKML